MISVCRRAPHVPPDSGGYVILLWNVNAVDDMCKGPRIPALKFGQRVQVIEVEILSGKASNYSPNTFSSNCICGPSVWFYMCSISSKAYLYALRVRTKYRNRNLNRKQKKEVLVNHVCEINCIVRRVGNRDVTRSGPNRPDRDPRPGFPGLGRFGLAILENRCARYGFGLHFYWDRFGSVLLCDQGRSVRFIKWNRPIGLVGYRVNIS